MKRDRNTQRVHDERHALPGLVPMRLLVQQCNLLVASYNLHVAALACRVFMRRNGSDDDALGRNEPGRAAARTLANQVVTS